MRVKSIARRAGVWQKSRDILPQTLSLSSPFLVFACNTGEEKAAIYTFSRNGRRDCLLGDWQLVSSYVWEMACWLPAWIRPFCIGWPTSHLLLQTQYDLDSLLQDDQLGLGLVALQVDLTHPAQLSEGFIYVTNTHSLPSVVSKAAITLPLLLLLSSQVLIAHRDKAAAGRTSGGWRGWLTNPNHNPHWPYSLAKTVVRRVQNTFPYQSSCSVTWKKMT